MPGEARKLSETGTSLHFRNGLNHAAPAKHIRHGGILCTVSVPL